MTALELLFAVIVSYSTLWRLARLDALRFANPRRAPSPWWLP